MTGVGYWGATLGFTYASSLYQYFKPKSITITYNVKGLNGGNYGQVYPTLTWVTGNELQVSGASLNLTPLAVLGAWGGFRRKRHVFTQDSQMCKITWRPYTIKPGFMTSSVYVPGTTMLSAQKSGMPWSTTVAGSSAGIKSMPEAQGLTVIWEEGLSGLMTLDISVKVNWAFRKPR